MKTTICTLTVAAALVLSGPAAAQTPAAPAPAAPAAPTAPAAPVAPAAPTAPAVEPAPAGATPAVDPVAAAREEYRRGAAAFEAGDLPTARTAFERAYELSQRPQLLFNLALTASRQGQRDETIGYLRRFLQTNPKDSDADEARAWLTRLDPSAVPTPPPAPPPVVAKPAPPPAGPPRWTSLALIAGGSAGLAAAVALGASAATSAAPPPGARTDYTLAASAGFLGVTGAALLTGGIVKLLRDRRSTERAAVLVPTPGGAALAFSGAF